MNHDEVIFRLWEKCNHGTRREDVETIWIASRKAALEEVHRCMTDDAWTDKATEGWKPGESFSPYYARAILALAQQSEHDS